MIQGGQDNELEVFRVNHFTESIQLACFTWECRNLSAFKFLRSLYL